MVSRSLSLTAALALVVGLVPAGAGCAGAGRSPAAAEAPSAVDSLVRSAELAESEGRLDDASASLERALRLAPGDADLWLRLARIRLRERDPAQAESLGLKAATLAREEDALRRAAWAVVAEAREALGDEQGAVTARRQAER